MPYRQSVHPRHAEFHAEPRPRTPRPRQHQAAAPAKRREYTLNHAGRQLRIGPITFWLSVSGLIIMALWSAATATYFAFRDDVLTRLIARQADMQYAYEDRVAELRGQVDRLTSRQLLDQEQVEQRIEQLARRQRTLEGRATALSGVPDPTATGSIRHAPRPGPRKGNALGAAETPKPSPINDTVILTPPAERGANLESRTTVPKVRAADGIKPAGIEVTLARLQESLDRVESGQSATLLAAEDSFEAKARKMRGVLIDLGINPGKVPVGGAPAGVGGPFLPPGARGDTVAFDRQLQRVQIARANVERLSKTLLAVPVRKPLAGEIDTSSGFGVRLDPFLRRPAMHAGLDFRGDMGEPARATAAGTVTTAAWSGGYGRMVEIDHGNGFSTRYGHLSEILVKEGQKIMPGQVIGRVGSTGRSTGPHLHYETRIDGEAVDPQKFLRAGLRLGEKL